MLYCSWDMARGRCNCYFSFWAIFFPFTLLTTQKMKISKKWKQKHLDISLFYTSVPKIMVICYNVPEIWRMADVIFIFPPFYPLNSPKNENFKKMKKNTWRYHHLTQVHQKSWSYEGKRIGKKTYCKNTFYKEDRRNIGNT